jgi:hypothetical protein
MNRLSALPILIIITLVEPLQAIAQQTQQQPAPVPPQGYYMQGLGTCGAMATAGHFGGCSQ